MSFKDQLQSDIAVFLNPLEFGETHNIDGVDCTVIVDNTLLEDKKVEGVCVGDLLFHIATTDFNIPEANSYNESITFDGDFYNIVSATSSGGMTTVILTSESNGRFITVKYRLSAGTGANPDLGIPGTKQAWNLASTITPSPIFEEVKNQFNLETNLLKENDVKLKVNKDLFTRAQLESYEYYLNSGVYSLISGQIIEDAYYWTLYLRKQN